MENVGGMSASIIDCRRSSSFSRSFSLRATISNMREQKYVQLQHREQATRSAKQRAQPAKSAARMNGAAAWQEAWATRRGVAICVCQQCACADSAGGAQPPTTCRNHLKCNIFVSRNPFVLNLENSGTQPDESLRRV
eukprot:6212015-Pleurochrysis_carterae.AAC.1